MTKVESNLFIEHKTNKTKQGEQTVDGSSGECN